MELLLQPLLGVGVLGYHHQPRGPLVQPVDRVVVGKNALFLVIIHQKITQRIVIVARSGVAGHAGCLIDYQQVLILVDDVKRARNRSQAAAQGRLPHQDGELLSYPYPLAGIDPLTVQQDAVRQPLDPPDHRAGQPQLPAQHGVHLLAVPLGRDDPGQPPPGPLLCHRTASSLWDLQSIAQMAQRSKSRPLNSQLPHCMPGAKRI